MLMKKTLLLFLALAVLGCSAKDWMAKFYAVQAENALTQAANMKKNPFEKRLHFYAEACRDFGKAYRIDREVFTLTRIEAAQDTCWKAGDREAEEKFRQFEEEYSQAHPQEARYGDAGVGLVPME